MSYRSVSPGSVAVLLPIIQPMMSRVPPSLHAPPITFQRLMSKPARLPMDPRVLTFEPFADREAR